ncbi:hypothetical protein Mgra_00004248 [Meloidogyne graminicola]|uniref:Uncharacterized protein n=1 Tax=Meloidogyne graminicola TaxID=189291 RepID=A0A8S9ZTC7_9BILA|nr:hypothetical protein Mgra_00004248 [Meloidogyne graminicola]
MNIYSAQYFNGSNVQIIEQQQYQQQYQQQQQYLFPYPPPSFWQNSLPVNQQQNSNVVTLQSYDLSRLPSYDKVIGIEENNTINEVQ